MKKFEYKIYKPHKVEICQICSNPAIVYVYINSGHRKEAIKCLCTRCAKFYRNLGIIGQSHVCREIT